MTDPRARFEALVSAAPFSMDVVRVDQPPVLRGQYVQDYTELAWQVYQAALAGHAEEIARLTAERDGALAMQPVLVEIERNKRREAEAERDTALTMSGEATERARRAELLAITVTAEHPDKAALAAETILHLHERERAEAERDDWKLSFETSNQHVAALQAERDALRAALTAERLQHAMDVADNEVLIKPQDTYLSRRNAAVVAAMLTSPPTPQEPLT